MSWSSRRRFAYSSIAIIALVVVIGVPAFALYYKAPTCSDGKMNGSETGVDCGGSCRRLCQNSFYPPRAAWGGAKFEKLADGLYNVSALIENQNIDAGANDVPYRMSLFDNKGLSIVEREGRVDLYPHRNSLAFESAVDAGKRIPAKVSFEFIEAPNWFKSQDALGGIAIVDKKYTEDDAGSSLEITLENRTLLPYNNLLVSVVLYDKEGNVIGFSRTIVDSIGPKNGKEVASYTWPINRKGLVTSIEVLPIITPIAYR
jgi:hypothetical protein